MKKQVLVLIISIAASLVANVIKAADFENEGIKIRLTPRTPQQMAAFYEARGFPRSMIERLNQVCFFTLGIKNKTRSILWHDLGRWKFSSAGKTMTRFDRAYWKAQWQSLKIPMASQSTFRWTLMPEQLDFRPQESEGGNITLPRGPLIYDIEAMFQTGTDKTGPTIKVLFSDIRCAQD